MVQLPLPLSNQSLERKETNRNIRSELSVKRTNSRKYRIRFGKQLTDFPLEYYSPDKKRIIIFRLPSIQHLTFYMSIWGRQGRGILQMLKKIELALEQVEWRKIVFNCSASKRLLTGLIL